MTDSQANAAAAANRFTSIVGERSRGLEAALGNALAQMSGISGGQDSGLDAIRAATLGTSKDTGHSR